MNDQNLQELHKLIAIWAYERNLVNGTDSKSQLNKLIEEVGELAVCINKKLSNERLKDAIGDCLVVLNILALQNDTNIRECTVKAWSEIKDRKGKIVDGIFVKENDQDIEADK